MEGRVSFSVTLIGLQLPCMETSPVHVVIYSATLLMTFIFQLCILTTASQTCKVVVTSDKEVWVGIRGEKCQDVSVNTRDGVV